MLTDGAKDFIVVITPLIKVGMLVFIGYALSRHAAWEDAVATTFVLMFTWRALAARPS